MRALVWVGAVVLAASACAPSKLAYSQVKSAMIDAGLSEPTAACMAGRMTDKLNLLQLNRLKQLKGEHRTLGQFVGAVRRVNDARALEITISSAALCSVGLARQPRPGAIFALTYTAVSPS